jgi:hypothetical protein
MDSRCDHPNPDGAKHPTEPSMGAPGDDAAGDIELIRWCLSLTPAAAQQVLQDLVDTFWTPRHG